MRLSLLSLAARVREDRRPLYRRIFTNRRLDIAHKTAVRSLLGFLLFSCSYVIVNTGIYYRYVRPVRQEERELLEQELIEADRSGFKLIYARDPMNRVRAFLNTVVSRNDGVFACGVIFGAGFELMKIHFNVKGVSFYKKFRARQLSKELEAFEAELVMHENLIEETFRQQHAAAS